MAGLRHRNAFKKYPEYTDAIIALNPDGCAFSIEMNDYGTLKWFGAGFPPTEEDIKAKLEELVVEYEKQTYKWERYKQYLTVEEQLAQLWDDMDSGKIPGKESSEWFKTIQEVKNNTPKPE
jgi:hypothetical protein